jgi:hypothetical protein
MVESKICPLCKKEFFPDPEDISGKRFKNRKYCSGDCYAKYHKRGNPSKTFICIWCHNPFKTKDINALCCCAEERTFFYQKRKAICNFYPWQEDIKKRDKELTKLKTQGKDYVLPKGA